MKLNKVKFREIDQKWIVFSKPGDIKSIYKKLKVKKAINPVLGYVYISHEEGIKIVIAGNVIKEDGVYHLDEEFFSKNYQISYDPNLKYHFDFLEDKVIKKIDFTQAIEDQIKELDPKSSILESRKIEKIDPFRHESYVDDVELLLKKDKKEEYLWARIEDCSKDNLIFVCSLLDSSKIKKSYKENTLVIAKLIEKKKTMDLEIDGIVDKVQK